MSQGQELWSHFKRLVMRVPGAFNTRLQTEEKAANKYRVTSPALKSTGLRGSESQEARRGVRNGGSRDRSGPARPSSVSQADYVQLQSPQDADAAPAPPQRGRSRLCGITIFSSLPKEAARNRRADEVSWAHVLHGTAGRTQFSKQAPSTWA